MIPKKRFDSASQKVLLARWNIFCNSFSMYWVGAADTVPPAFANFACQIRSINGQFLL
jgi:hypothetical protein